MTDVVDAPAAVKPINHWIGGSAYSGQSGRTGPVFNPATGEQWLSPNHTNKRAAGDG